MTQQHQQNHATWECKYHVVFSKRGKSRGSQAVAQRCLTIAGKYGTSGWFGTARREPR